MTARTPVASVRRSRGRANRLGDVHPDDRSGPGELRARARRHRLVRPTACGWLRPMATPGTTACGSRPTRTPGCRWADARRAGVPGGLPRAYRLTLALKCDGLDAEQLATKAVPPSTISLLGLVRHMARVEQQLVPPGDRGRGWTCRGCSATRPRTPASTFPEADDELVARRRTRCGRREVAHAREVLERTDLDQRGRRARRADRGARHRGPHDRGVRPPLRARRPACASASTAAPGSSPPSGVGPPPYACRRDCCFRLRPRDPARRHRPRRVVPLPRPRRDRGRGARGARLRSRARTRPAAYAVRCAWSRSPTSTRPRPTHRGRLAAAAPALAPAGAAARHVDGRRLRPAHQRRVDLRRPVRGRGLRDDPRPAARPRGQHVTVFGVDKFPRMIDYVVPTGVRIADADRVRLGAHLAEGTTVMHEGFVNFNAGTLGTSMVEGRISAGVVVGDGSDVGGGASIMGTLSGGGKRGHLDRRALPARRQRRHRHLPRRRLRRRGRLLRHRRHQGHRQRLDGKPQVVKAADALRRRQRAVPPQLGHAAPSRPCRGGGDGHRAQRRAARQLTPRRAAAPGRDRRGPWPPCAVAAGARRRGRRAAACRSTRRPRRGVHRRRSTATPSSVDLEQAENAALIAAIAVERGLPARAAIDRAGHGVPGVEAPQPRLRRPRLRRPVPAAAVAGLGHRRAGHATRSTRPTRSTTPSRKVDGYETMEITEAAQEVQRSAFPDAYADHEEDAPRARLRADRQLAAAPSAATCRATPTRPATSSTRPAWRRAPTVVRRDLEQRFGAAVARRVRARRRLERPHGGSAHYEGRAVDVFFRPINAENTQARLGDGALPRRQRRPARHPDRHLRRPDLAGRVAVGRRAGATTACRRRRAATGRSSSTATTSTSTSVD